MIKPQPKINTSESCKKKLTRYNKYNYKITEIHNNP